jgi:hypothetical protein
MAVLCLDPLQQFFDDEGDPLAFGELETLDAVTSDPRATYTDNEGLTEHENPIVLDAAGRPPSDIFYTQGAAYNLILRSADEVVVRTLLSIPIPVSADNEDFVPETNAFGDAVCTWPGNPDEATQWLGGERFPEAVAFAANWSGSYGKVPKTLPTGSYVVTIKKNNVTVGTATCSTLGVWTFATSGGSAVSFAAGDEIDFYAPLVPDATIADFGITLHGTLA